MSNSELYSKEELRAVQLCELEILKKYVEICEKHNLVYFLDSGTALGAARHQGFIPWDDDIDVGMPRRDYERFLEIAQEEFGDEYFVQNVYTDPECPFIFSKIRKKGTAFVEWNKTNLDMNHGVFMDVFPYDVLPEENAAEFMLECNKKVNAFYMLYITKRPRPDHITFKWRIGNAVRRLISFAGRLKKKENMAREMEQFFTQFNNCEDENCSYYCPYFFGNYEFKRNMMLPPSKLTFEGEELYVPKDHDKYLSMIYGDYMKFPPVEKRVGHRPLFIDLKHDYEVKK